MLENLRNEYEALCPLDVKKKKCQRKPTLVKNAHNVRSTATDSRVKKRDIESTRWLLSDNAYQRQAITNIIYNPALGQREFEAVFKQQGELQERIQEIFLTNA